MIWLLASAFAADPVLEARLLGPAPQTEIAEPAPPALPPVWPVVAVVGLGLALVGIRKPLMSALRPSEETSALCVVARQGLGQGGLAVVDVTDPSGEVRRLLVGTGPQGPRLLADLSADFAQLVLPEEDA